MNTETASRSRFSFSMIVAVTSTASWDMLEARHADLEGTIEGMVDLLVRVYAEHANLLAKPLPPV